MLGGAPPVRAQALAGAPDAPRVTSAPVSAERPRFCTACGTRADQLAKFCGNCGAALPSA